MPKNISKKLFAVDPAFAKWVYRELKKIPGHRSDVDIHLLMFKVKLYAEKKIFDAVKP